MPRAPRDPRSGRPALSRLELEIIDVVWKLGDCTSAEVTAEFRKKRPLAPTTIRTVLTSLREKGYIRPIPAVGRGFRWRAVIARDAVVRRSLRDILSSLFHGSRRQAIACLLDDSEVTDADLDEIRRMIEARRQGKAAP